MQVKYYVPGNSGFLELQNINDEDKNYILENNLIIELEQLPTNDFVVYLRGPEQQEEDELMELATDGRTCEDTIAAVVSRYKKEVANV